MPLRITKTSDPMEVSQLTMTIIGQPGIGKTSLGFTACEPLLLDFDHGAHRSAFRKDTVVVDQWEEVAQLSADDLASYKTVVVDTGGRALDKITEFIIRTNPKAAARSGNLTLPGYGELKAIFMGWIKRLRDSGKDIVILTHDAEDRNGDDLIIRPDIQGGSRQEVIKCADAIAYLYKAGQNRILDFNPTDRWIGKNCAGFAPLTVPNFHEVPGFFATVIADTKAKLNERSEEQRSIIAAMAEWQAYVDALETLDEFNGSIDEAKNSDARVRDNVKRLVLKAATQKGFKFDKKTAAFVATVAAVVEVGIVRLAPEAPEGV